MPDPAILPVTPQTVHAAMASISEGHPVKFRPTEVLLVFLAQRELARMERDDPSSSSCTCHRSNRGEPTPHAFGCPAGLPAAPSSNSPA